MADLMVRARLDDGVFDLVRESGRPTEDGGLTTAILASLLTWRRANEDDTLPTFDGDRKGWWADAWPVSPNDKVGSRLWLLTRTVVTARALVLAKAYGEEALAWLVDDGIAEKVVVTAHRLGATALGLVATVHQGRGAPVTVSADLAWESVSATASARL